jgi:hypothetical protein
MPFSSRSRFFSDSSAAGSNCTGDGAAARSRTRTVIAATPGTASIANETRSPAPSASTPAMSSGPTSAPDWSRASCSPNA